MKKTILSIYLALCTLTLTAQNKTTTENNSIRIMSYNIHAGIGMDSKLDIERLADIINNYNPDIVALQEVDSVTNRINKKDMMSEFSSYTLMHGYFGAAIPHDGGKYGIGILSKEKPINKKQIKLPGREEARTLLMLEFENYYFFATHWSLTEADQIASARLVSKYASLLNKPVFFAGDLNASPESKPITELKKEWKILNNPQHCTFPSVSPNIVIDYILGYTAKGQGYSVIENKVIDEKVASDHRPIYADIIIHTKAENIIRTQPYIQNPEPTQMTIMWQTNVPCRSWVEYREENGDTKVARVMDEGMAKVNTTLNKVELTHLKPGTKYTYRVVSQEMTIYKPYYKEFGETATSNEYAFTTWDDKNTDFTAIIFNDIHRNHGLFNKLHEQIKDIKYDFVIYNGDCIDDANTEYEALYSIAHYNKMMNGAEIPGLYIRGNHEIRGAYSTELWNVIGKLGGTHTYTAFNYGDTRFVVLDCGEDKPDDHWVYYGLNDFSQYRKDQLDFLYKEQKSKEFKKAKKRVLLHHIPIFGENQNNNNPCKEIWEPTLAKGKYDVSINAHTHKFEYIPKNEKNNKYPVIIGGDSNENSATVMILKKEGTVLTLQTLNTKGESMLNLNL